MTKKNPNYFRMAFLKATQYAAGTALVGTIAVGSLMAWAGPQLESGIAVTLFAAAASGGLGFLGGLYKGAKKASQLLEQNMALAPN